MPRVTRSTVHQGRNTRNSRAVFLDVSNNAQSQQITAVVTKPRGFKKAAPSTQIASVVRAVSDEPPKRRRSSRLSGDDEPVLDGLPDKKQLRLKTSQSSSVVTASRSSKRSEVSVECKDDGKSQSHPKGKKVESKAKANATKKSETNHIRWSDGQRLRDPPGNLAKQTGANSKVQAHQEGPPTRKTRSKSHAGTIYEDPPAKANRSKRSREKSEADADAKSSRPKRSSTREASKNRSSGDQSGNGQSLQPTKRARRTHKTEATPPPPEPIELNSEPSGDFLKHNDFRLFRGNLMDQPFDDSKFTRGIAECDKQNQNNVDEVAELITDMMQRFFATEISNIPDNYMTEQSSITWRMRGILVDWLIEVHSKFRLAESTLYLTINILDRYLSEKMVDRNQLQLVGVSSLFIACKYEEIYPPELKDCTYICDNAYTAQDVLDMETDILKTLHFKVSGPTAYPFLVRFLHITGATNLQRHASHYYMDRMLQEDLFLKYRPSLIAASCVCLALNNPSILSFEGTDERPGLPTVLLEYTGFDGQKILKMAKKICDSFGGISVNKSGRELTSAVRKYGMISKLAYKALDPSDGWQSDLDVFNYACFKSGSQEAYP